MAAKKKRAEPAAKKHKVVQCRIDPGLKEEFDALSTSLQTTPSALLRKLIEASVAVKRRGKE